MLTICSKHIIDRKRGRAESVASTQDERRLMRASSSGFPRGSVRRSRTPGQRPETPFYDAVNIRQSTEVPFRYVFIILRTLSKHVQNIFNT
jgi:hypothetical protein